MIAFLRQLAILVKPYKVRLAFGVLTGIICGLIEPLMILTITFVFSTLFPSAGISSLAQQIDAVQAKAPEFARHWLEAVRTALPHDGGRPHLPGLLMLVGAIPCVIFLRGLFGYLNIYFLQWATVRAITDLRTRLFTHLMNLSSSFFSQTNTGELMSRIGGDTGALQSTISHTLQVVVKDPATLIGLLSYLLWTQPKVTLLSLVVLPVCIVPIVIYSRKVRHSSATIQTLAAELSKLMVESFTGNRIIKAYNLEARVAASFHETSQKFISHVMRVVRAAVTPGPLLEFFGSIGVALECRTFRL